MNKKILIVIGLLICVVLAGYYIVQRPWHEEEPEEDVEYLLDDLIEEDIEDEDLTVTDLAEMGDDDEEGETMTLEEALPVLEEAGYVKTADGYVGRDDVDGVKSERIVTAEGNHMSVDLSYDYGDANKDMIKFFKKNDNHVVDIMLSSFLVVVAERANAEEGDMDYVVYVGGTKVCSGTMTLDQAMIYQEMAMDD